MWVLTDHSNVATTLPFTKPDERAETRLLDEGAVLIVTNFSFGQAEFDPLISDSLWTAAT